MLGSKGFRLAVVEGGIAPKPKTHLLTHRRTFLLTYIHTYTGRLHISFQKHTQRAFGTKASLNTFHAKP